MYRAALVEIEGGPRVRCCSPSELAIHAGDLCVFDSGMALEFGRVKTLEEKDGDLPGREMPRLLRRATLQDQAKAEESVLMSRMGMKTCAAAVEKHGLKARLVQGRYSFDRTVFTVLFTSEERVDVRENAKALASELRARVEMKQIGVRDEAGLIGGVGPCGRELCCSIWLHRFESVNVKMAKAQGLSLNPAAIGGCCGRLKCCLSYEYELYRELGRRLPPAGARVQCADGKGCVVGRDILGQTVQVRLEDERVLDCKADAVKEIWTKKDKKRRSPDEHSGIERAEPEPPGEAGAGDLRDGDAGADDAEG